MYRRNSVGWIWILWMFTVPAISAAPATSERVSPDSIEGSVKVDAEGLIALAEKFQNLTIIDSRISSDRIQGHIEGSLSLPDEKTNCDALKQSVAVKTSPVVFYCNGPKCGRSAIAVKIAVSCGFENVFWFRGGFEEWKDKKYPYIKE